VSTPKLEHGPLSSADIHVPPDVRFYGYNYTSTTTSMEILLGEFTALLQIL